MLKDSEIAALVRLCEAKLPLATGYSGDVPYHSLPLCVIDTVFSIGARYEAAVNAVSRFCEYFSLPCLSEQIPPQAEQLSVSDFVGLHGHHTASEMAETVYQNRQRTSTRNGILKAGAVLRFANVLQKFQVDYYQDSHKIVGRSAFESAIAKIPGQASGISTRYFYMRTGAQDYVKPDRMVERFISSAIQRTLSVEENSEALIRAQRILVTKYAHLTPRALDALIWTYQREQ
jgi:hypothetical protein